MRNKKLLSTVLASSLVATTMAMPVMAAGGEVDVNVGVKSSVLRVQVPTSLAVEIDQFEIAGEGSQIYSETFDMTNLSNINVKVDVKSQVVQRGADVNFVASKEEAATSKSGDAWLAVAAKTNLSGTKEYGVDSIADLKESNANVKTFNNSGDAEQNFYLKAASGDPVYGIVASSGDAEKVGAHTQFYPLDGEMTASGDVVAKVKTADVYVVKTDNSVKKLGMGATDSEVTTSFSTGDKAYVISGDAKTSTDMKTYSGSDKHVWGQLANADEKGKASFRYVAKLSESKTWTKNDISKLTIAYDIEGVAPEKYAEVEKSCVQGLYNEGGQSYTDEEGYGTWSGSTLWIAKDSSNGFSSSNVTVEVSDGGTTYVTLSADKYSLNDANWISTTWANITSALGAEPSGTVYVRITDGTTRYTFAN